MTPRLVQYICNELTKIVTYSSVPESTNISISTIIRIFNHTNYGQASLSKVLCIDKFKGNAETGKYQCILIDSKKNKVLDILQKRTESHLTSYFKTLPPKDATI